MSWKSKVAAYSAAIRAAITKGKQGTDWQYYPGGTLGEKEKIVFWCRDRKNDEYPAVFGDLRVEIIPKDELPPLE